jgi:very-short-patch-repair endonuclease
VGPSRIPLELKRRPFLLAEARAAGISRRELSGRAWRRIGSALYCWSGWREDTWQLLDAWHKRLPAAVFIGRTAAWLHGLDLSPTHPIEVAVPLASGIRSRPGLVVRRSDVSIGDVMKIRSLPTTPVRRTLADLCRRVPDAEALVALDAALRRGYGRVAGRLGQLAEPAESPMETRLRWLLLEAGLPRPQVQADLHDRSGGLIGRADLFYPGARLVIEYDGANHRDRLVEDNRRQNLLLSSGFRLLRFTASDLAQRPETIPALVRAELAAASTTR